MFATGHALHGLHERVPGLSLLREHAPSLRRDLVQPAPAFIRLLDPAALDPSTLLDALEQGIQGVDVKGELPA